MLLKFKVQRQPIIPASSWDKNPIVQHTEIWCCLLLLISFYWKGKKKKGEGSTRKPKALPQLRQLSSLSTHAAQQAERKPLANRTQKHRKKIEIWRQNHPLGCQTCPGVDVCAWESCGAAALHSLEWGTGQEGGDAAAEQLQSIHSKKRPINTKSFPQTCSTALGALDT